MSSSPPTCPTPASCVEGEKKDVEKGERDAHAGKKKMVTMTMRTSGGDGSGDGGDGGDGDGDGGKKRNKERTLNTTNSRTPPPEDSETGFTLRNTLDTLQRAVIKIQNRVYMYPGWSRLYNAWAVQYPKQIETAPMVCEILVHSLVMKYVQPYCPHYVPLHMCILDELQQARPCGMVLSRMLTTMEKVFAILSAAEWETAFFQTIMAHVYGQEVLELKHHDCSADNVMFSSIPSFIPQDTTHLEYLLRVTPETQQKLLTRYELLDSFLATLDEICNTDTSTRGRSQHTDQRSLRRRASRVTTTTTTTSTSSLTLEKDSDTRRYVLMWQCHLPMPRVWTKVGDLGFSSCIDPAAGPRHPNRVVRADLQPGPQPKALRENMSCLSRWRKKALTAKGEPISPWHHDPGWGPFDFHLEGSHGYDLQYFLANMESLVREKQMSNISHLLLRRLISAATDTRTRVTTTHLRPAWYGVSDRRPRHVLEEAFLLLHEGPAHPHHHWRVNLVVYDKVTKSMIPVPLDLNTTPLPASHRARANISPLSRPPSVLSPTTRSTSVPKFFRVMDERAITPRVIREAAVKPT